MRKMPYRQTRSTTRISATLPLRFFFIVSLLYSRLPRAKARRRSILYAKTKTTPALGRRLLRGNRSDGALCNFHLDPVRRHLDYDDIVLDGENDPAYAPRGRH